MKVYGDYYSGNCYKVALLCRHLNIAHDWVAIDILAGESHTPEFEAKNPNGKIPMLELDDGRVLTESNAILNYLADGSDLLPNDGYGRAQVLQWQFFEQYSHEPYVAVARYIKRYLGLPENRRDEYHEKQIGGHKAFQVMQMRLASSPWLAGNFFSIADISLYAYSHAADEGGFDLTAYPAVQDWLTRVAALPKHISMEALANAV